VTAPTAAGRQRHTYGKDQRLLAAPQYKAVFDNVDIRVVCPQLMLLARYTDLGRPRLGLVVARKHLKLATQRNRVKRQIRESFRHHRYTLPAMDIIVMSRPGIRQDTDLATLLAKQWQRLSKRASESCATA